MTLVERNTAKKNVYYLTTYLYVPTGQMRHLEIASCVVFNGGGGEWCAVVEVQLSF